MSAWKVFRGKRLVGRVLARDEADALIKASQFWGDGPFIINKVIR